MHTFEIVIFLRGNIFQEHDNNYYFIHNYY